MKRAKIENAKRIIQSICVLFLIFLYWLWLFCITPQAGTANTFELCEMISDVEIIKAYHRGTDKLLLFIENECYLLDTGMRSEDRTLNLAKEIKNCDRPVELTVWEHIPKSLSDMLNTSSVSVKQIVDLRTEAETYFDIEDHNAYQRREKLSGLFGGLWVIAIVLVFLYFWNMDAIKKLQKICVT